MTIESLRLSADATFWPAAARAVRNFAELQGAPARQLQTVTWLVPGGAHAVLARAALREVHRNAAFIPPRIAPLPDWLGHPMSAGTSARAELFAALRASPWVRASFGTQPAALWALAGDVARLCDELTWAAVDGVEAFEGRFQASLARHFHRRAARALQPQAQLVLQLWRARRAAEDGAARVLRTLDLRAARAAAPLVYVGATVSGAKSGSELDGWEAAFLQRFAQRAPVLLIVPEVASALRERPLLAAAWPELAGTNAGVAIAARADMVRAAKMPAAPLTIFPAASLEEEAMVIARQVLAWRRAGVTSIALVALDRLTARRVRALLERAQVIVRDETGWKLSTTSAAAAVMRWYDLVADDLYWRDLVDWLKSTFTLAGRQNKQREVFAFERAIRAGGALQGAHSIRRALAMHDVGASDADAEGAQEILALIEAQATATRRAGPTLAAHALALQRSLDALGMRSALAGDAVGRTLLRELEALQADLVAIGARATLADFHALLAARFEEASFVDRDVDSPIVMVSLTATSLRSFDAALLIGADARHLPVAPSELFFMSNAVRAELGLATAEQALHAQATQLAALLASVPRVAATWRIRHGDEPNALSPLLERLQFVARRAFGEELLRAPVCDEFAVEFEPLMRPAPRAARLLPARLSASHAQSMVDCAYQFYARRMLQLAEPDDVIELPDKRDFGIALHEVLRRFHREWGGVGFHSLDAAQLGVNLRQHASAVFSVQIERAAGMLAFARRFDGLVDGYVSWLRQHSLDGWRWSAGEEAHAQRLALADGQTIELTGRVDRVDTREDAASGSMLVLDYKARAAVDLKRNLKSQGEDIQLPFYGLLLARRADAAAYLAFERGKEGDPGVHQVDAPGSFDNLVEAVESRLRADLQRIADGAPLPAIGADSVCARCEMRGLCRRDYWERVEAEQPDE